MSDNSESTTSGGIGPRVTTRDIQMTEIAYRDGFEWARIRYQEDTGFVAIQSDYGNWSFGWPRHGRPSLAYFLSRLDVHYMGGKMLGAGIEVFDAEESQKAIRRYVIECRREAGAGAESDEKYEADEYRRKREKWLHQDGEFPGNEPAHFAWTEDRAREEWHLTEIISENNRLDEWYERTSIESGWEIAHYTRMEPSWKQFWDRIWRPIIRPELDKIVREMGSAHLAQVG